MRITTKYISALLCFILLTGCTTSPSTTPKGVSTLKNQTNNTSTLENIYSKNAIFINLDTNTLIFSKLADEKIAPASLTKIMSAIIAIEYYDHYTSVLSIEQSVLDAMLLENSSLAGFTVGEKLTIEDLLYGTLLSSGGEATLTLANDIAGNEDNFVELMNQKAKKLGLENTHFTNACGFDNANHYSTVKDISTLLTYCLENETFKKIFTTKHYTTTASKIHPDGILLSSTMFDKIPDNPLSNGEILGGKTGYTENAGLCLASIATVDNSSYLFVSTNASGNHNTTQYNISDAITAYQSIKN